MKLFSIFAALPLLASDAYTYHLTGNAADARAKTTPGIMLAGGGKEVDAAFEWFLDRSGGGDVVVLRASGADGYHDYLRKLRAVDSVETIVFRSADAARDPFVIEKIRSADAIFLAGGDQWNYVRMWKDSPVEDAIHERVGAGVPIGGNSAGLAVLGEYAFSAEHGTVSSAEALADPAHPKLTISSVFLSLPGLDCLITDSHFSQRDRMGRLLVMMARISQRGRCRQVFGLGVDERTAVLLETRSGRAQVVGEGAAYRLRLPKPGTPIEAAPLRSGEVADLRRWRPVYKLHVDNGAVRSTQPGGRLY